MQNKQSFKSSTNVKTNFNTAPVTAASNVRDGDSFVLITKGRDGETRLWSSGDQTESRQLLNYTIDDAFQPVAETTG